jgi:hypothetical protein
MVNHAGSSASSNAVFAGVVALAGVVVYWYMSTTEEQRAEQAAQMKEKADEVAAQAAGMFSQHSNCFLC